VTRRRIAAAVAALLFAAGTSGAAPVPAGDAAGTVLALEAERVRAMTAGDLAALERVLADDAVYTHSTGVSETRAEFIGQIRSGTRKYGALTLSDLKARPAGAAIVVTGRMHGSVETEGKTIPLALIYTAVYAERDGRWRLAAYESTRLPETSKREESVHHHATGSFDVKTTPLKFDDGAAPESLGRYAIEKRYHGPLDATAKAQMLTVGTKVEGSAVYVAVEVVDGTLDGRKGTFALHHTGTMTRGTPALSIAIVPDSGTGELAGISGSMSIRIEKGGAHFYDLEYAVP
jgi:ketosteroid isomerase-like protein